jgi:hypothetical protein
MECNFPIKEVSLYWSPIFEVLVQFANQSANIKQAQVAEEISQTLLTNMKLGIIG